MSGHPAGPAVTPSTLPDVIQRASTATAPSRDTEDTKQADDPADVGLGGFSSFPSSFVVTAFLFISTHQKKWRPNTFTTTQTTTQTTTSTPRHPTTPHPPSQNNAPRPPASPQPPTPPLSSAPAAPRLPPASLPATTRQPPLPTTSTLRTAHPGHQQQHRQHRHHAPSTSTTLHSTPDQSSSHQPRNLHQNDPSQRARSARGRIPRRDTTRPRRLVSSGLTLKGWWWGSGRDWRIWRRVWGLG